MVLSPWGSTSWAMRSASVVAMSTLAGTTTKLMVSCLRIYFLMRDLICKKMKGYESWDRSWPCTCFRPSKNQTQRNELTTQVRKTTFSEGTLWGFNSWIVSQDRKAEGHNEKQDAKRIAWLFPNSLIHRVRFTDTGISLYLLLILSLPT